MTKMVRITPYVFKKLDGTETVVEMEVPSDATQEEINEIAQQAVIAGRMPVPYLRLVCSRPEPGEEFPV